LFEGYEKVGDNKGDERHVTIMLWDDDHKAYSFTLQATRSLGALRGDIIDVDNLDSMGPNERDCLTNWLTNLPGSGQLKVLTKVESTLTSGTHFKMNDGMNALDFITKLKRREQMEQPTTLPIVDNNDKYKCNRVNDGSNTYLCNKGASRLQVTGIKTNTGDVPSA
jgi:hypothetical protein